ICVEEFDPPTWHAHLIRLQRTVSAPTRPEGEQRRRTGAWHTRRGCSALSASCPKELYPKSGLAAGRLIHCFDRISADGLDRLVTVRAKVSPGLRFEEGLCLLKAVPFRDCHALGWGWSVQSDDLSAACAEITTSCVRLCSLDALCNTSRGLSIERFGF